MALILRLVSLITGLLGVLTTADLKYRTSGILLWPLKLAATAIAPLVALLSAVLGFMGIRRRDPIAASLGLLGAMLSSRYVAQTISPHQGFDKAFGPGWQARIPPARQDRFLARRWTPLAPGAAGGVWQRNVAYGANPKTGTPLVADLWLPPEGTARSGLGVLYVHGGAWRLGTKDMGTRPFFRRLASQGHVVMDVEYTLAPATDVPGEVRDVKRALVWLKQNAGSYGVDPERIVLIGGSAGGHLALLTAYSPNDPELQPDSSPVDTSVRAVVSFYGPADFLDLYDDVERNRDRLVRRKRVRPYGAAVERLLQLSGLVPAKTSIDQAGNYIAQLLGAEPFEQPEIYRQLSPTGRVGPHCPPTLLLQGTADIFGIARSARRLVHALQAAGVASILVEFPNTDHAFDLVLPRVSPAAQAATYDVERFLALMV